MIHSIPHRLRASAGLAAVLLPVLVIPIRAQTLPKWCTDTALYSGLQEIPVRDSWFRVFRVHDNVFAIAEPYQSEQTISYLIIGRTRALLFDTGMGIHSIRAIVTELTTKPIVVLNSHTHSDHIGGDAEFREVWGVNSAYTRNHTRGLPNSEVRADVMPDQLCRPLPAGIHTETFRIRPFRISHVVKDGDVIDLGGRRLEVIATPGHTPDSIVLFDSAAGLLFTGDTFYAGPVYLKAPETDLDAYERSVARLAALRPQVKLLLPAHNAPIVSPAFLERLPPAIRSVRTNAVQGVQQGDAYDFRFDGFSLLVSARALRGNR